MLPGGRFSTNYNPELAILRTKAQWGWLAVGLLFLFVVFPAWASPYWTSQFIDLLIIIVAVLGLHILTGLGGLVSIGHAAFMGIGAYTVAILTTRYDVSGWICLPLSALAAGLVGVFFGLPSFRLKLFYLAIATLAGHEIIIWILRYREFWSVTKGFTGIGLSEHPLTLGGIDFSSSDNFYYLAALVMIAATIIAKNIQRTHIGRTFVAIRDNELAAEVSGVPIFRSKLIAFFIGCAFAGVAGWLWAYAQLRVNPSQFDLLDSIWYLGMLILGGWGSTTGVFMGAIFLKGLEIANSDYLAPWLVDVLPDRYSGQIHVSFSLILFGVVIIFFIRFLPWGLYYEWEKIKLWYRLHPYSYI